MKKIAIITLDYPPQVGGVAEYLRNLADQFDPKQLVVIAQRAKNSFLFDLNQPYVMYRLPFFFRFIRPKWLHAYRAIRRIIRKEGIEEIIISHVLPVGYICLLLKLPFTVICHGYDVLAAAHSNPWKEYWLKRILNKSKHIVVNSNFTKNEIVKLGIDEKKIIIAHPCPAIQSREISDAEIEEKKTVIGVPEENQVLFSFGRLVERKGFDMVLLSLAMVLEKMPNLTYVIAGDGPDRKRLQELVKKYNIEEHVIFAGKISSDERDIYYSLCDVFCMPARIVNDIDVEGFGMVYLEANVFGKPVIGGKSGGVPDAIIDGENGLLVEPEDPEALAEAILRLLSDEPLRMKMGMAGAKRVKEEFTWEKQFEKVKDLFNE
jgi:phosphatidylinositol alpha-1,6-mannosyltransferase